MANRVLPQLDLAEERLGQFAQGERGALRIGMECHPCYQWLLKDITNPNEARLKAMIRRVSGERPNPGTRTAYSSL